MPALQEPDTTKKKAPPIRPSCMFSSKWLGYPDNERTNAFWYCYILNLYLNWNIQNFLHIKYFTKMSSAKMYVMSRAQSIQHS